MSGMIGVGRGVKGQARAGLENAARAESHRNRVNDELDRADKAGKKQTLGTLAGAGLEYGLTHAGAAAGKEVLATHAADLIGMEAAMGSATSAATTAGATATAGTAAAGTAATAGTAGAAAAGVGGTGVAAGGAAAGAATAVGTAVPFIGLAMLAVSLFS